MPKLKIISGGQTGVDIAGLRAAKRLKIETGGSAPKGWLTEEGPQKEKLEKFGLVEHFERGYPARTRQNVLDADMTLIIGDITERGSALTRDLCVRNKKPIMHITFADLKSKGTGPILGVINWIHPRQSRPGKLTTINIAGNRESISPGIEELAEKFLFRLFEAINTRG